MRDPRRAQQLLGLNLALLAVAVSCGGLRTVPEEHPDAGARDSGTPTSDGGRNDAGLTDAGLTDAGSTDAGARDSGSTEDGGRDASFPGVVDAGPCDGSICPPELRVARRYLPMDLAVDDQYLYWTEEGPQYQGLEGTVNRIRKSAVCLVYDAGCADAIAGEPIGRFRVETMALTPADICWIEFYEDARELLCADRASGTRRKIADNQYGGTALAALGSTLFWANTGPSATASTGQIASKSSFDALATPPALLVQQRPFPTSLSVSAERLAWGEFGTPNDGGYGAVYLAPTDGGPPQLVADRQPSPLGVSLYGDAVYWANYRGGAVKRAPLDGGVSTVLASGQPFPVEVLVDESGIYWLNLGTGPNFRDGTLWRMNHDGSDKRLMADGLPYAQALAADATHVYFAVQGTQTAGYSDGRSGECSSVTDAKGWAQPLLDGWQAQAHTPVAQPSVQFCPASPRIRNFPLRAGGAFPPHDALDPEVAIPPGPRWE